MNPQGIAKLRRTFIAIAMSSFFVVIAFLGTTSFLVNLTTVEGEASRTIDAIIDAGGEMPGESNFGNGPFHEEAVYGLRYFAVTFDGQGNTVDVNLANIASINEAKALEEASVAADPSRLTDLGYYENYIYKEGKLANGNTMVVFLDCTIQLVNLWAVGVNTLLACLAALLVTFVSVFFFSKRAVRTEIENAHRQQQFMTNASHELKTPIAVIRANTELTEMMSGETEWTQSTMRQVERLDGLVRDLMSIVRSEERQVSGDKPESVDVSQVVGNAIDSFKGVALQNGLTLERRIDDGVKMECRAANVEQLVCLLADNAMKYCDENGTVTVRLSSARLGRGCTLVVSNNFSAGADVDYKRFFERFYREDEAHENQQGYGIGLSVAESLCRRMHGSIKASWKSGVISFTCVLKGEA